MITKRHCKLGLGHMETDQQKQGDLLQEAFELIEKLSDQQRATLAEKLLGRSSGLTVVFGNNLLSAQIIFQIQQMTPDEMAVVLQAIAERMKSEKSEKGEGK